jgi:tetratricopeptide (TPR) repeat protein
MLGTPAYAAPEQVEGRLAEIDARTDVYGLGGILYHLLTGSPPFKGKSTQEVLRRVVHEVPEDPRKLRPAAPRALAAVCMKALAKRREERYQSAGEFADELNRWLADEPVLAMPETPLERAGRWIRRRRKAVAAAGLVGALAIVGLALALYFVDQERQQKARADGESRANLELAQQSIDRFLTEAGESPELATKGLDSLRLSLLTAAKDFYRGLAERSGERPEIRRESALAALRVADISRLAGDRVAAVKDYEEAIRELLAVTVLRPDDAVAAERLGDGLHDFGLLLVQTGEHSRAAGLLEECARVRLRLSAERPDDIVRLNALGQSHLASGVLHEAKRDLVRAVEETQAALAIQRKVAERNPSDSKANERLALAQFNLATFQMNRGALDEAFAGLSAALETWEKAKRLGELYWPHFPASALVNLGKIAYARSDSESARKRFRQAVDELESLIGRYPLRPIYRAEYASALSNLAAVASGREESLAWANKAVDAQRQLVRIEPDVPRYRQMLGMSLINKSKGEYDNKRFAEALAAAQESRRLLEAIAEQGAASPDLEEFRAQAAMNVAIVLSQTGRHREALAVAEEGSKLKHPIAVKLQASRALYLARAGDHATAVKALEAAVRSPLQSAVVWESNCAAVLGAAAGAVIRDKALPQVRRNELLERHAEGALAHLRQAAKLGAFSSEESMRELSVEDPDFEALRGRADFQAFVKDLKPMAPRK